MPPLRLLLLKLSRSKGEVKCNFLARGGLHMSCGMLALCKLSFVFSSNLIEWRKQNAMNWAIVLFPPIPKTVNTHIDYGTTYSPYQKTFIGNFRGLLRNKPHDAQQFCLSAVPKQGMLIMAENLYPVVMASRQSSQRLFIAARGNTVRQARASALATFSSPQLSSAPVELEFWPT